MLREPGQRELRRQELQVLPVPGQRAPPGLQEPQQPELRQRELRGPVLPEPWELPDPEQVLRDVILPTGQAPWARLPEQRP